jgi:hypothetical protein
VWKLNRIRIAASRSLRVAENRPQAIQAALSVPILAGLIHKDRAIPTPDPSVRLRVGVLLEFLT